LPQECTAATGAAICCCAKEIGCPRVAGLPNNSEQRCVLRKLIECAGHSARSAIEPGAVRSATSLSPGRRHLVQTCSTDEQVLDPVCDATKKSRRKGRIAVSALTHLEGGAGPAACTAAGDGWCSVHRCRQCCRGEVGDERDGGLSVVGKAATLCPTERQPRDVAPSTAASPMTVRTATTCSGTSCAFG
jgi:hypothetical protein